MPSDVPWVIIDHDVYNKNRSRYGHEELRPYAGEWLAWSLDGSTILAHHPDAEEVRRQLIEKGTDPGRAVMECMPAPEDFDKLEAI